MNTPPPASKKEDETVVIVKFDPSKLPPETRLDLEANAQLQRVDVPTLISRIIGKRLGNVFTVTPSLTPAHG